MRRIETFILVLLGGFCCSAPWGGAFAAHRALQQTPPHITGPLPPGAMISSTRVPFVANEGQVANPDVKYYARTFGGTVYALADGKIVYSLPKFESGKTAGSAVITEILRGAFRSEPSGAGKSRIAVSSFIGNQPEKWKSNLPVFDRLDFGEVYEGITLLLSARGNNVEKIFALSPGADPREIISGFEGASGIEIMSDGKLELQTALGKVYFTRPVAWQIDARGKSWPVAADYALGADGAVQFEIGRYDRDNILIIDPLLASTFIGGGGADAIQAMAVDSQTNVYVAGYTASGDFPVTNGAYSSPAGGDDVFVSKFDANLGSLSASTYIGGSSNDQATAIGIASDARIWLAGYTESANFPETATGYQTNYRGARDAFVAILSTNLNSLVQATYLGGSNADSAAAIAMDNLSRRQYVVGYTESGNFPVTNLSGYATNYSGARDAFAVVFSNNVTALKGGTFLGGTNADEAAGVVVKMVNLTNYLYVVGSTSSTNFPVTNAYQRVYGGGSNDAFVSRLSLLLTNLPASTFLGGTGGDMAYAAGLDISNGVYVAGYTRSDNFPRNLTNIYLTGWTNRYCGGQDIFVSCLTNNLTNLYASTYIGGANDDVAKCLVMDSNTNRIYVYLAGYTASADFPTTRAAYDRSYNGGGDAFILRMDGPLTNMYAATYLGGESNDQAQALALAPDSNTLFVAGTTASSNFPSSDAAYQNVFGGGTNDGFVTKFPASLAYGTLKWRKFITDICSSPALTWDGTVVVGASTSLIAYTRSGDQRWEVPTTSAVAKQSDPFEGLGVPAVGTNNVIYINTSSGKAYAITAAGVLSLLFQGGSGPNYWSAIALDSNERLFFGQLKKFYAVGQNGASLWTNSLLTDCKSSPSVSSNGIIYTVASDSPTTLYAFNTNGSTNYTWTTDSSMYSSPALGTNGTIYAAGGSKLYAFSPDGLTTQTWTAAAQIYSSPAIGSNGVVYVGSGNNLYSFNPADNTTGYIWHTGGEVKSSPAIAADGSIIVGSTDTNIYSFSPADGTTNWVFSAVREIQFQSPLIDSEGNIYFSDNAYLYAIYGPSPPADSAWPMFRHDALRTGNQGMNVADFLKPTGLTASGNPDNYIRVGWNASSNAINYELWRNTTDSTAGATRLRRLTQTNYNDSSVVAGQIYHYWVKVKTPVALSAFSAPALSSLPPAPPTNVAASKGIPTNYVHVTWQASSNAVTNYVWSSRTDNSATAALLGSPTPASATNYEDYAAEPGLTNYYWVKAANAQASESAFSASTNAYGGIPCRPPSGLSASQTYTQRVDLSWSSSTGASSYLVYRNTENNSGTAGIITNPTGSPMSDYTGTPMRRYYYWLRATNEFGLSGFNDPALGWRLLVPPLSVSASSGTYPNMIRVSWVIGSIDATAYVIFRSLSSDSASAVRQAEVVYNNDPTATNYDDTAITRGPDYYYWVAAKNIYGSSAWTSASAPGGTRPATPTDLNATDGTYSNMVKVAWNSSAGAIYYTVYRYETSDSSHATEIGPTFTNFYNDRSALNGILYYYWVKAANNYGISDLSTFNSGWRGMVPPDSITAGDGISTSEVSVTWNAAVSATFYELWRGTNSNVAFASRLANNVSGLFYSDQSANPGTVYYYWVKSKYGTCVSAFSDYNSGYRAIGLLDIGISDFVFVPTVFAPLAHPATVSFKVSNFSALDMNDPNNTVQYDFYLTRTPNFGDGEAYWFGGTNTTLTLSAGASTRVALSQTMRKIISIPVWATGNYYVFVFANHCLPSAWLDPNLTNNISRRLGDSISIASFTALQPVWNDFDGDGKSDLAVYSGDPSAGGWKTWLSASDYAQVDLTLFGGAGYRAVPRDYDGDGKFDPAVYNEANGAWLVCLSASGYQTVSAAGWGGAGQDAVPADYDGDGCADPAVYQSSSGTWRAWLSSSGYAEVNVSGLGGFGWQLAQADYDGDGKTDPAVYQSATGGWRVWLSGSGYQEAYVINWGGSGQRPVPADYDADGKVDPAVYNESIGLWRVWLSSSGYRENSASGWGGDGQTAAPGDYDGDGKVDPAVYWESMGIWRVWLSSYGYSEVNILVSGGEGFHAITAGE